MEKAYELLCFQEGNDQCENNPLREAYESALKGINRMPNSLDRPYSVCPKVETTPGESHNYPWDFNKVKYAYTKIFLFTIIITRSFQMDESSRSEAVQSNQMLKRSRATITSAITFNQSWIPSFNQ